jgi:hypothetical protein
MYTMINDQRSRKVSPKSVRGIYKLLGRYYSYFHSYKLMGEAGRATGGEMRLGWDMNMRVGGRAE